jgi:hypothetical protein
MSRSLALAVLALLALSPAALGNPSIAVSSSRDGSTARLPAKVNHVLTLTAGATAEELTVSVSLASRITVTGGAVVQPPSGVGPSVATCPGRWSRMHEPYRTGPPPNEVTLTIAAGQSASLAADVELIRAPWADETLDATWFIEPRQGRAFDVVSNAPLYSGPLGVKLAFTATRAPDGHYVVAGTTEPSVNSGRIELWAFPPGRTRATRIARVGVRNGSWSFNRFLPARTGRWELYARYRTAGRTYANDTADCGTFIRVR